MVSAIGKVDQELRVFLPGVVSAAFVALIGTGGCVTGDGFRPRAALIDRTSRACAAQAHISPVPISGVCQEKRARNCWRSGSSHRPHRPHKEKPVDPPVPGPPPGGGVPPDGGVPPPDGGAPVVPLAPAEGLWDPAGYNVTPVMVVPEGPKPKKVAVTQLLLKSVASTVEGIPKTSTTATVEAPIFIVNISSS